MPRLGVLLLVLTVACSAPTTTLSTERPAPTTTAPGIDGGAATTLPIQTGAPWWQGAVFYEIFVRSFQDSDGDGIGDIDGVIQRLDYLNDGDESTQTDLGIEGIWLMPMSESPSYHGYDVVDYRSIEADYGSVDDMRRLVEEAHRRGIRVIVDLVVNHTSVEHPWFLASAQGDDFVDWYVWSETDPGYRGPWGQDPWHRAGDRYYYGVFWEGMPDLDLTNADVTAELVDVARWWLEEVGVDGFRIDAAKHLIEDGVVQENTPESIAWLETFREAVADIAPNAFVVGEVWDEAEVVDRYVPDALDAGFDFTLALGIVTALRSQSAGPLVGAIEASDRFDGSTATFLTNHDMDRVMSTLGSSGGRARLAAALLLTLPGTPFVYYGEEVGMTGTKPDELIRTPMWWDDSVGRGFTDGEPWQPIRPGGVGVAAQDSDPDSLLSTYRTLIHLRNATPALAHGDIEVLDAGTSSVVAYVRSLGEDRVLVVANLSRREVDGPVLAIEPGSTPTVLFGTSEVSSGGVGDGYRPVDTLRPFQAVVVDLG